MRTRSLALRAAAVSLPLALAAAPAAAAPRAPHSHELSYVIGREGVVERGTQVDLLAEAPLVPQGLRLGVGLDGPWSVVGGWQRHHRAQSLYVPLGDDYEELEVVQGFTVHQVTAGVKAQRALKPWLAPYATAQASLMLGRYLLDEDIDVDDNPNQLRGRGAAVGGVAALGVDLRPLNAGPVRLGTHFEVGYGLHSRLTMEAGPADAAPQAADGSEGTLGGVALRGLHLQWGVGLRF